MKRPYSWDFYFKNFQEKGLTSLYDFSNFKYTNRTTKSTLICRKCGHEFLISVAYLIGGLGCPFCKSSKGERTIAGILSSWKIPFIQEKVFNNSDIPFRWDFWVPETKLLIEYQGEQHFRPVSFKYSQENQQEVEKRFQVQLKRDFLKKKWAQENEFKVLYLLYKDSFEQLKEKLYTFLKENKVSFTYTEEEFQNLKEKYRYRPTKERQREIQRKSDLKHKEEKKRYQKEWCERNKERLKQQREARKEEISSYMKKRYQKKKEEINDYNRRYRSQNKEKLNKQRQKDRIENPEKYKTREKTFYEKNKEYYRKYAKEYYYRKKALVEGKEQLFPNPLER